MNDAHKKIAFAASFGATNFDGNEQDKKTFKSLIDRFDAIHAETPHNLQAIAIFVNKVNEISEYFTSSYWNGEDVMAIFFNEFNRYKGKSESERSVGG